MSVAKPLLMDREEALVPASGSADAVSLFERLASNRNTSVDKIERLMGLYERVEAKKAEAVFNAAMAAAQREMRPVATDSYNPQTKSKYASYEALDNALRPIYTEHGFGLSFDTGDGAPPLHVRVLCYVSHAGGHSRTYKLDMPADGKGAKGGDVMTLTHATGSGLTYGQRYLLKMIFNIAVGDGDDDGNRAGRAQKQAAPPPAGFESWWDDLEATAQEGLPALQEAWKKSDVKFRNYVQANSKDAVETLKRKAGAVRA